MGNDELERTPGHRFALAYRDKRDKAQVDVRTLLTSTTASPFVAHADPTAPKQRRRRLFVQDLIPRVPVPVTTGLVPYVRELLPLTDETDATMVAEGSAKPEVQMRFEGGEVNVRKISAWIPLTDEIRADGGSLSATVDGRLLTKLKVREEAQVLSGDGTGQNLLGLLGAGSGIQTTTLPASSTPSLFDVAAKAAQLVEDAEGALDAFVMNTDDFWTYVRHRAGGGSTGDNHYDLDPFEDASDWRLWRVPVVRSRAIPAGSILAGAFQDGATIRDREDGVIRVGEQHADFFTTGKAAVLAEQREALQIDVPPFFCVGTLA